MLVFRSEGHLESWLVSDDNPRGEAMTLDKQWELAKRWFEGRHLPQWKRRTPEEAEELFREVGLTSDFWRMG
jgi:hypothetical protein